MNKKRRKPITAQEAIEQLQRDPEYRKQAAERERRRQDVKKASHEEQKQLAADLAHVGVKVKSAWELVNAKTPYPAAIPVLLDHLRRPYSDRTKEGIARALAVPEAKDAWDILLEEFENNPETEARGPKYGIGCALSAAARATGKYNEVVRLLRDKKHGECRGVFLSVLALSKDPEVRLQLEEFVDDPALGEQARWHLKHPGRRRR